jgi:hypothetical protein
MDFGDALRLMRAGHAVQRRAWSSPETTAANAGNVTALITVTLGGCPQQLLVAVRADGSVLPFGGAQWDLLGEDWEDAGPAPVLKGG